jgi:formiminotetrahydrofolate cyclodeaminase
MPDTILPDTARLDTRSAPLSPLLERPLGQVLNALADGDVSLGDGSLAAVAAATSAGRLIAACTELIDRPECAPRLLELVSVQARTRGLHQRVGALVDDVATAEMALSDARGLPSRDVHDQISRRAAVQVALKRALDRRLAVASIAAELIRLTRDADVLGGGERPVPMSMAETLAGAALSSALSAAEREIDAVEESWLREYVGSEIVSLRHQERTLARPSLGLTGSTR